MEKPLHAGPLRILIVSSRLEFMGGAEKNVLDVSRGLRARCHVEVIGMRCGPLIDEFRRHAVAVHDANVTRVLSLRGVAAALRLAAKLRRERFDLVVTYHHDADMWAGTAALLAGVPVISSRRDMGYQLSSAHVWIYRVLNHVFRRIVAVSDAVKAEIVRTQWANPAAIVTVHNGLEKTSVTADGAEARRDLGLDPDRPVIGMVASFRRVKGQEFFVKAAAEVLKERPDAQFVIVGDTNSAYFSEVAELIKMLGLEGRVRCPGPRSDIPRVLKAFDIFALPSRQEGFSNALVEAMAAGLPCVAAAVGGNPEAIDDGVNGFLFDAGDHSRLASHILRLLKDRDLRRIVGSAATAKVDRDFSYNGMLDELYHVFRAAA